MTKGEACNWLRNLRADMGKIEHQELWHYEQALSEIADMIEQFPFIERKKGSWIDLDSDEDKYDEIKCPCCNHIFTVDSYHWTDIGFIKDDFKFCPNCGADMSGEQDDAEG